MQRRTFILLFIFLLLAILVWFMQQPDNAIKQALATSTITPSILNNTLINPDQGPIEMISFENAEGINVTLDKTGGFWAIKGSNEELVDQNLAETIAGQVLNLQIIKKFETAPKSEDTGLNNPDFKITIKISNGSLVSFEIGKATVIGSGYYVGTQDGTVYILSKSEIGDFVSNLSATPYLTSAARTPSTK